LKEIRWGHFDIVKYLLDARFDWPERELRVAYLEAKNSEMKKILKDQLEKTKRPFLKRIFSCY